MYELQWLAFQADLTRVVTFMLGRELNFRTYPEIGLTQGHHTMSHHQERPENIERYAKLNTYQTDLFAAFLSKLASTPEGDGTLLDHSLFLYGGAVRQPELARAHRFAADGRRRAGGPARRRAAPRRAEQHADVESALDAARRRRRARRVDRRQHGALRAARECVARVSRYALLCGLASGAAAAELASVLAAAKHGTALELRSSLAAGANPNEADADGTSALHWAVHRGDARQRVGAARGRRRRGRRESLRRAARVSRRGERRCRDDARAARSARRRARRVRRGRDVVDDGRAHGRRRDDRGSARGGRRRRCAREPRRADRADGGGRREQRRGGRRRCSRPAPSATCARRPASSRRSGSPCGPAPSTRRARCSTPAPMRAPRYPTARACSCWPR